jgi:uncharacterized membrane protein
VPGEEADEDSYSQDTHIRQQDFSIPRGAFMNIEQAFEQYSTRTRRSRRNARPWAEIAGGSALAFYGVSRRNLSGAGMAALGGLLVYHGIRSSREGIRPIHLEQSFTIMRPVEEVYGFWRNFENFPRFMQHLKSVRNTSDRQSHWEAHAPIGTSVSWDAEITDERPNEYLVWQSMPDEVVTNRGSVEFRTSHQGTATVISVAIDYSVPAGKLGAAFAKLFGEEPEIQVREDLRRLKQLLEAGEIPTIEGQSSGRRSPWVRMMQAATADRPRDRSA